MKISIEIEMECDVDDNDKQHILESISDKFGSFINSGFVISLPDFQCTAVTPVKMDIKEVRE